MYLRAVPSQTIVPASPGGSKPFPLNRVIAFLGPYIAIASGAGATWLSQHFPGLHVEQASTASAISQAIIFVVGTAVTWALHHKWLDGWQKWEARVDALSLATVTQSLAATTPAPVTTPAPSTPPAPTAVGALSPATTPTLVATPAPATVTASLEPSAQPNGEETLAPYPGFALREGVAGPEVRAWQQRMAARSLSIVQDGSFGPQSTAICRTFQELAGLLIDGIVGPDTWRASFSTVP
jgi:murein L,D-transpeptidase YcbB/YkuD